MRMKDVGGHALTSCVAAAVLAGCAGAQPQLPAAPATTVQVQTIAPSFDGRHDWLYVVNLAGNAVTAYHARGSGHVLKISQSKPSAMAFGAGGRIFVATDGKPGFVDAYGMRHGQFKERLTQGIDGPKAISTDGPFLFVGNSNASGSYVGEYRQRDLTLLRSFDKTSDPITAMAVDQHGSLYVASLTYVRVYSALGKLLRTITKGLTCAGVMTFDQSANLWVANYVPGAPHCRGNITEYEVGSTWLIHVISKGLAGPVAMSFENTQELWVANNLNNTVAAYSTFRNDPDRVISNGVNAPTGVAITIFGHVFVSSTGSGTGWVTAYEPGATSPYETITDGIDDPVAIELVGAQ